MTNLLLSNPYVEDILHQPEAIKDTLSALACSGVENLSRFAQPLRSGTLRRVVLTGMGSSYHALHPLHYALLEQGFHTQMIETSELIHYARRLISPDALLVVVSQSGNSAEVLRLLEQVQGIPLIGITNTSDSPLASKAEAVMLTRAGPEHTVSCKTYVTALVALSVLGKLLTGEGPQPVISDLLTLPDAVAQYLSRLRTHVDALQQRLAGVQYLMLAGRGPSLAAAETGGLIIKEAAHFPAEGMSSAAFRHGPIELVSTEVFVLVYDGGRSTSALNTDLITDIQNAESRSALVTTALDGDVFHLPPVPVVGLPVLEILPAQVLSLALALMRGHTPGDFVQASKVTSIE